MPSDPVQIAATLDVVREDEWRRTRLREVTATLARSPHRARIRLRGWAAHIISLPTGPDETVIQVRHITEDHDVFASVFCPPATPRNRTALRLSLHCDLTGQDVNRIVHACEITRP